MRYAFLAAHVQEYSVKLLCRVLQVSRSGYYAFRGRGPSRGQEQNRQLLEQIEQAFVKSRRIYGSPRITHQLWADGVHCSRGRVERLMAQHGLGARPKRRYISTTDSGHALAVAPNVLARAFKVSEPNQVWASDLTFIPTQEGWLYLAGVLDLCSRLPVGWSMGEHLQSSLVLEALQMAYTRRRPAPGLLHHSDRGSVYASEAYRMQLEAYGMRCSMSRKGNVWDNAPMESFFGILKRELVSNAKPRTRQEARQAIFEYIEVFYNRERLHSSLGYLCPVAYEQQLIAKQVVEGVH